MSNLSGQEPPPFVLSGPVMARVHRDAHDDVAGFDLVMDQVDMEVRKDPRGWSVVLHPDPDKHLLTRVPTQAEKAMRVGVAKMLRDRGVAAKTAAPLADQIISYVKGN